jgi:hypothetical protein
MSEEAIIRWDVSDRNLFLLVVGLVLPFLSHEYLACEGYMVAPDERTSYYYPQGISRTNRND